MLVVCICAGLSFCVHLFDGFLKIFPFLGIIGIPLAMAGSQGRLQVGFPYLVYWFFVYWPGQFAFTASLLVGLFFAELTFISRTPIKLFRLMKVNPSIFVLFVFFRWLIDCISSGLVWLCWVRFGFVFWLGKQ